MHSRCERLHLDAAMAQAIEDAGEDAIPYVAHKRNRKDWLVTVKAKHLLAFARAIVEHCGKG